MKTEKRKKLKKILETISSPEEMKMFDSAESAKYLKIFSKEIGKIQKIIEDHDSARGEFVRALNLLDDKHQELSKYSKTSTGVINSKLIELTTSHIRFTEQYSKTISSLQEAISGLEKGYKEGGTSLEKLRKEFLKNLNPLIDKIEELGSRKLGNNVGGPEGVGGSRTTFLNGVNISPFDMYGDINWLPGTGVSIVPVNNTTTNQVDVTISVTGGSGGGSTLTSEIPSGTIDGTNTVFTVANTPIEFFWNGQFQNPNAGDYAYATGTITMATAPSPGDNLLSFYNA